MKKLEEFYVQPKHKHWTGNVEIQNNYDKLIKVTIEKDDRKTFTENDVKIALEEMSLDEEYVNEIIEKLFNS